ncbi:MAG: hypothetical protein A2Y69_15270 [Candidatus Aminicenantes bacterium RBG_13_59_9]|nr:MAG: hypothetical protein A2Y69_15270 [Candidatus Aminicenantes bacterium RBG_13_59_9]
MNSTLRRIRKKATLGIFIGGLIATGLWGWYDKVHTLVLLEAVRLIERVDKDRPSAFYPELSNPVFLKKMMMGCRFEDYVPVLRGNERSFRHYYDPDAPAGQQGCKFYYHYYAWPVLEGSKLQPPASGYFDGTRDWALDDLKTGNILNWPGAISAYDYTQESKEVAYFRLGHVGHLLGDMSEVDHGGNIPHPGSGKILPDTIEEICGEPVIAAIEKSSFIQDPLKKTAFIMLLRTAYILVRNRMMGEYAGTKFMGYEGLAENLVDFGLVKEYFELGDLSPQEIAKNEKSVFPSLSPPLIAGERIQRFPKPEDYFDTLAREGKKIAAATHLPPPVGLANLVEYLASQYYPPQDLSELKRYLELRALAAIEPVYIIPTINIKDVPGMAVYEAMAWEALKRAVEYNAGLLEMFHDIVNPPPYIQGVTIVQEGETGGRFSLELRETTAERKIPAEHIAVKSERRSYPIVTSRERIRGEQSDFGSDGSLDITIVFGPSSDSAKKRMDPGGVLVTVGGTIVPGRLTDENKWQGSFFPDLGEDVEEKDFDVEVTAKDLGRHLPRPGLPDFGYEIDSDPDSPAKALFRPPYGWDKYEPGPMKIGTIKVKAKPEPTPEEEEETEEEPTPERTFPTPPPPQVEYFVWVDRCGAGPGGRIHVGAESEFKSKLRCCDEWLFGMSQEYIQKDELAGPFGTLEEAVRTGCGMVSEAAYRNVPGWGAVPYAKMGGTTYLLDEELAGACIKER